MKKLVEQQLLDEQLLFFKKQDPNQQALSDKMLKTSTSQIFSHSFKVESLQNPHQYLPKYQQEEPNQPSCVQNLYKCCGNICIGCSYSCALFCCKCSFCLYELETSKAGLVEEFGRFSRLLRPGLNTVNPCTQQVSEVDLKIQVSSTYSGEYITRDNVKISVKSSIAYRILNPIISNYILGHNINRVLVQLSGSVLRNVIGQEILDEVLTEKIKIVKKAKEHMNEFLPPGICIEGIFMEDVQIPKQTLSDLSSAAKQRRISEASIINSQADVEVSKLMKESADLLDTKAAMQIRYLEIIQSLGIHNCKVIMPIGINKIGFKE